MDLRYIQSLLSHSETTEVYTRITKNTRENFYSPLDFNIFISYPKSLNL